MDRYRLIGDVVHERMRLHTFESDVPALSKFTYAPTHRALFDNVDQQMTRSVFNEQITKFEESPKGKWVWEHATDIEWLTSYQIATDTITVSAVGYISDEDKLWFGLQWGVENV